MTYYELFSIPKTANDAAIKEAYRKLAHKHHPDKGGNSVRFKEIITAYKTLIDPVKRSEYDRKILPWDKPKQNEEGEKPIKPSKPEIWNVADIPNKNVDLWGEPILEKPSFFDSVEKYESDWTPKIR